MLDEGVSSELAARCLYYESNPEENVKRETLKLVTNSKSNKLWDIPTLENAGKVSLAEIEGIRAEHGGREPPYYYVTNIRRVFDDRTTPVKEYLVYNIHFEGISVGKREWTMNPEPNMRITESALIGYHLLPRITWDMLKDRDGEQKRVGVFSGRIIDDASTRVYEIPFSREIVEALLKHTKDGQVAFQIDHLSKDKHYGVATLEEFLTDDLPSWIEQNNTAKPTYRFDVDPKKNQNIDELA
jgi:hypothetical protein